MGVTAALHSGFRNVWDAALKLNVQKLHSSPHFENWKPIPPISKLPTLFHSSKHFSFISWTKYAHRYGCYTIVSSKDVLILSLRQGYEFEYETFARLCKISNPLCLLCDHATPLPPMWQSDYVPSNVDKYLLANDIDAMQILFIRAMGMANRGQS